MKRSEINTAIRIAKDVLEKYNLKLPPFAYWAPSHWHTAGPDYDRVRTNGLGWDVTDFGINDFDSMGAVLFTLRNGNYIQPEQGTPYAEKFIVLKPGQRLPIHYHWAKTEDIINRCGGVLVMELYKPTADNNLDRHTPLEVFCDGRRRKVQPGVPFELLPGQSVTVTTHLYHRLWAKEQGAILVCGEVSTVNDDIEDNCFGEPVARFATIEEDEPPLHLLCNEYPGYSSDALETEGRNY